MNIKLLTSPKAEKKYRVVFESGKVVDFGRKGYSDYTIHKTPSRMRSYVARHAGNVPKSLMSERDPKKIQNRMLRVTTSTREKWGKNGIDTAGFWSRWLTWSFPTLKEAIKYIEKTYNVKVNGTSRNVSMPV